LETMMMMTSDELISRMVKYSTMQLAGHRALLILKLQAPSEILYNLLRPNQEFCQPPGSGFQTYASLSSCPK
jgi:hypothetical protein